MSSDSDKILNISTKNQDFDKYDVVGPVCESSDVFATNYNLPISLRNDIIVICSTGAYGESMSSNYNLRNSIKSYFSNSIWYIWIVWILKKYILKYF